MKTTKRAQSFLSKLSLRTKVTLLLLVISLGPLLAAGSVNVNRAMDRGKKSAAAHFGESATFTASAFADLFEHIRFQVRGTARRFPAERFDFDRIKREIDKTNSLRPSLDQWPDASFPSLLGRDFHSFFLATPKGQVFYSHPYRNVKGPVLLTEHAWFNNTANKGGLTAGVIPALTGSKRPTLIVIMPLFDNQQNPAGYLGAIVDRARLQEIITRMFSGHSALAQGTLMLTSKSNLVMAHNVTGRTGKPAPADLDTTIPGATAEIVRADKRYLITKSEVAGSGWHVRSMAPTDHVYRFVHVLIRVLIVVTVLTFLFVLLLADYLARLLLSPITELERGAQMVGSGVLDYRIELEGHHGDELGRLARSFNSMGDSLLSTQKQIRAYSRSLESAHQELDAMVYAITHDLRKSLRGIGAYTNFLKEDFGEQLGESGQEMLSTINVNVERITQLTDDLVGLVHSDRDKADNEHFELSEVLDDVRERALKRQNGEMLVCGDMPIILGDRARLTLVFDHLAENGLKFNRHAVPCVEVSYGDDGLEHRIEFTDNGIGIPAADSERVFELFSRLNPQDEFPGSGTGLNIARRIVADHRGRISVEAIDSGGTRISVHLPKDGSRLTSPGFRITDAGEIEPVR